MSKQQEEFDRLRERLGARLIEIVTVLRPVRTADGSGGQSEVYNSIGTTTGFIEPLAPGEEAPLADVLVGRQGYRLHVTAEADVKEQDRVSVGGITYEVLAILAPFSGEPVRPVIVVERR